MTYDPEHEEPSDDADTPREPPREIREVSGRRSGGVFESGDARHLRGFRARDTGRLDAVPDERPSDETTQPLRDLPPELQRVADHLWGHIESTHRRATNRVLEVHQAVATQPEAPAKKWIKWAAKSWSRSFSAR